MRKIILLLVIILGLCLPVFALEANDKPVLPSEAGQVLSIETFGEIKPSLHGELNHVKQSVEVKILTGSHKGEKVIVENMLMGNPAYDIKLKTGDKVILHAEQADGGMNFFIADKKRVSVLYALSGLFFALLIIIGRKKGLFSLISILITLGLIFWALTPLILSGLNPILATVLICVLASVITIYLVGGFNAKSTAAILGTVLSLSIAGILSILSIKFASLTGFSSEESMFLFNAHPTLNFVGVLASAMIIGALGAVMDIGMSISSTINELFSSNTQMTVRELFASGMNVGQDIIGTMANTLILAYLGGALSLVLLSSNIDLQKFFNLNQVATEISAALIGSIAIVLCVPITAIIAAYLIRYGKK
ncbi:MAG: YibE/F family protein [Candidatus Gastranaerophilales bacterium]|nr:YibE/F family protein [Candidatus Gastranaerophilales bacterium]